MANGKKSKININRMRWGYGKMIATNYYYEGFFENNLKCGYGRIIHHNGDVYTG